ncbi:hypothetical protein PoB_000295000 [Plakobranchus ocellatus]|uniref:Uncharacterized protein n=1 Tax=Plakobranchus ocellatus TaxID=259542 RepID=A0AAV3Y039_9GAST|nr:hypothetical protein PoB_000295000 [Plakobranchus ocellatus]
MYLRRKMSWTDTSSASLRRDVNAPSIAIETWGNVESLYGLLPNRRAHQLSRRDIGFTVRSYRNPAKAEILAEFPDPLNHGRPKTVPIQRPLVPSPYFFQHNGLPGSGPFKHQQYPQNRLQARPGALGQFDVYVHKMISGFRTSPSDQGAGGGARTREKKVSADDRLDSLSFVLLTLP